MNGTIKTGLILAAGILIGALADQLLMRKKFNERLDREIEAVKAYKFEAKEKKDKPDIEITAQELIGESVSMIDPMLSSLQKAVSKNSSPPYAITAEEFGEEEGYNSVSLYYYTDDEVVTDEADNELDNVDEILGEGALDIFVYTNAESCFIRNDEKRCDYEVIKHEGSFEDYSSGVMGDEDG